MSLRNFSFALLTWSFFLLATPLLLVTCIPEPAFPSPNTGDMLYDLMEAKEESANNIAEAYITGTYEMLILSEVVCLTDAIVHDDIIETVYMFLDRNEEIRVLNASECITFILSMIYPCIEECD